MRKKLFIVSDIHGFYTELKDGLKEAGYDEKNDNHLLIVCGDIFDRGRENVEVYKYLKRLSDEGKAMVLKGNHDQMFINYLDGTSLTPFNYIYNGTDETFADFLHETAPFESWSILTNNEATWQTFSNWLSIARRKINKEYPELLQWLKDRLYYCETKNYIFTHGAIDTETQDWHEPNIPWKELVWDNGSFFEKHIANTSKTVVIGHFGTSHLRKIYGLDFEKEPYEILKREDGKVIAIDGTTVLSHKVNVLVVEDELI